MAITFIEGFDSYPVESKMTSTIDFQRPHHDARAQMEDLIVGLFRDDLEILQRKPPEGSKSWLDYYDSIMLARLEMVGQAMGWEAPVCGNNLLIDEENRKRVDQWKPTYHVMRAILLAEITNQLMASERFNHLLDQYSDKMNTDEAREAFTPPESVK